MALKPGPRCGLILPDLCRMALEMRWTSRYRGRQPLLGLPLAPKPAPQELVQPVTSQVSVSYLLYGGCLIADIQYFVTVVAYALRQIAPWCVLGHLCVKAVKMLRIREGSSIYCWCW